MASDSNSLAAFFDLFSFFGPKILVAIVCGGMVGLERELKNKTAGIKTNILICTGAAIYTAVSVNISQTFSDTGYFGDPARIAAQIVTGVGFLGGGTIIQSRGGVIGLTTAASIWVVAAIGICVGLGYLILGIVIAFVVVLVLTAITILERKYLEPEVAHLCKLVIDGADKGIRNELREMISDGGLSLQEFTMAKEGKSTVIHLNYRGSLTAHQALHNKLWLDPRVREVKLK